MLQSPPADAGCLLDFNVYVLDQALALIALHQVPSAPSYANPVGAHLRHVIEHYWALVRPACPGIVDYDARARNRELEQSPDLARVQIIAITAGPEPVGRRRARHNRFACRRGLDLQAT